MNHSAASKQTLLTRGIDLKLSRTSSNINREFEVQTRSYDESSRGRNRWAFATRVMNGLTSRVIDDVKTQTSMKGLTGQLKKPSILISSQKLKSWAKSSALSLWKRYPFISPKKFITFGLNLCQQWNRLFQAMLNNNAYMLAQSKLRPTIFHGIWSKAQF